MDPGQSGCMEWHPIRHFVSRPGYEFAVIVLNQPIRPRALFKDLWAAADLRVAADGGANRILELDQSNHQQGHEAAETGSRNQHHQTGLDVIVGDLDSLSDEARTYFTSQNPKCRVVHEADQYSTDFTKAVRLVRRELPARSIFCMGGLGGRVDQGLSQLHHLYMFQTSPSYADGRLFLVSGESLSFLLKAGRHRIHVRETDGENERDDDCLTTAGDPFAKYVGIIPVKEPSIISTRGLEWDVENWPTEFGGQMSTSNHILPETTVVEVETTKDVLFTVALK
ncbi:thiamine pyrophosphokinase [Xylariomycetidae sp. FL0641]|nr:thiamine pyrophosphokinase [Xylariomycetidae sp. FL0641]